jgi:hypothetical protein
LFRQEEDGEVANFCEGAFALCDPPSQTVKTSAFESSSIPLSAEISFLLSVFRSFFHLYLKIARVKPRTRRTGFCIAFFFCVIFTHLTGVYY